MGLKKGLDNYISSNGGFAEDCLEVYENCADNLSNNLRSNEISILIFFQFSKKKKQKPIRNSCRSNSWSTPILILWNIEFKILTKEPGDEALLVSFKFPMREWDQRLVDFNRCSSIETQSCYFCLPLLLYLHGYYYTSMVKQMLKVLVDCRR